MRWVREFAIFATYNSTNRSNYSMGSNAKFRNQLGVVVGRADGSKFEFLERREGRESLDFARSWATCYGRFQWGYYGRLCLGKPFDISNAKRAVLVRYPCTPLLLCDISWWLLSKSAVDFAACKRSSVFPRELSRSSSAGIAINSCYGGTKKRVKLLASTRDMGVQAQRVGLVAALIACRARSDKAHMSEVSASPKFQALASECLCPAKLMWSFG